MIIVRCPVCKRLKKFKEWIRMEDMDERQVELILEAEQSEVIKVCLIRCDECQEGQEGQDAKNASE